jgi:hypothetical protein
MNIGFFMCFFLCNIAQSAEYKIERNVSSISNQELKSAIIENASPQGKLIENADQYQLLKSNELRKKSATTNIDIQIPLIWYIESF